MADDELEAWLKQRDEERDDEEFNAWLKQCEEDRAWNANWDPGDEWIERYGPAFIELCQGFIDNNCFAEFFATPEGRRMQRDSERWYAKHAKRLAALSRPRRARERKPPSLTRALLEAKKAGVPVAAATVTGQGVVLTIGEAAKTDSNELDEWMEKHKNAN
jgi:hypothetical protein